jgi:hypothetical protein
MKKRRGIERTIENYNTIDIDRDDDKLLRCLHFLMNYCHEHTEVYVNVSPSGKGWHVKFFCRKPCLLCRFLFDDPKRLKYDLKRPVYARNVLWHHKWKLYRNDECLGYTDFK